MKAATYRAIHKYVSLTFALVWLIQIVTGSILVFHREIDDLLLGVSGRAPTSAGIETGVTQAQHLFPDGIVTRVVASGGLQGQFEVLLSRPSETVIAVRIDGATGQAVRSRPWEDPITEIGWARTILLLHQKLLVGDLGHWFIGASPTGRSTSIAQAIDRSLELYPRSSVAVVDYPTATAGWYRVRLLQEGEPERVFGTTIVYIDASSGAVVKQYDPFRLPLRYDVAASIYPLHTGEIFGPAGRILVQILGLTLLATLILGVTLWWRKRELKSGRPPKARSGAIASANNPNLN